MFRITYSPIGAQLRCQCDVCGVIRSERGIDPDGVDELYIPYRDQLKEEGWVFIKDEDIYGDEFGMCVCPEHVTKVG